MRSIAARERSPIGLLLGGLALGLAAGAVSVALDVRQFAAIVLGIAFVAALWRVWLDPKLGLYLAVVAFSLDSLGKLSLIERFPLTLYQVTVAVVLIAAVREHRAGRLKLEWKKTRMDVPIVCFLGLAFITVWFAPDLRGALMTFASLVSSVVLFYLIVAIVDDPKEARNLLLWLLAVATVLGLLAIGERLTGVSIAGSAYKSYASGIRIRGSFKDPNVFGMLLMTALAANFPLMIQASRKLRTAMMGMMGVTFLALLLTFSRGAWLGLALAVAATLVVSPSNRLRRMVPLLVGLMVAVATVVYFTPPVFVEKKIVGLSQDTSTLARVYMLTSGAEIIRRSPFGVGLGGFPDVYPEFRLGAVRSDLVQSHTSYLTIAVEMGLLGLGLFVWLLIRFFSITWPDIRSGRPGLAACIELAASAAAFAILVEAWSYSVELAKQLWFAMGLAMAAYLMASHEEEVDG